MPPAPLSPPQSPASYHEPLKTGLFSFCPTIPLLTSPKGAAYFSPGSAEPKRGDPGYGRTSGAANPGPSSRAAPSSSVSPLFRLAQTLFPPIFHRLHWIFMIPLPTEIKTRFQSSVALLWHNDLIFRLQLDVSRRIRADVFQVDLRGHAVADQLRPAWLRKRRKSPG